MAEITITLRDTTAGGVAIHTTFKPAIGQPCTPAQGHALEIIKAVPLERRVLRIFGENDEYNCCRDSAGVVGLVDCAALRGFNR